MAALTNTIKTEDVVTALDVEFSANFDQEVNQLVEILGIFGVETVKAGTAMYQYQVTGSLNTATVDEGDEVPLSKYEVKKVPIGEFTIHPYRKLTTAQAILKSGFENAVRKTDHKMVKDMRANILNDFFTFLGNGTGTSTGAGLQAALIMAKTALEDKLEDNNDATDKVIFFVNRTDIAGYLATAEITTQTLFGMTYIKDFLGIGDVFVTNKVTQGTMYATPVENIHIYGVDFGELDTAGISYEVQENSLIGVHHQPAYDRTSAETYALSGATFLPEVKDYIVKGTVTEAAKLSIAGDGVPVATTAKK